MTTRLKFSATRFVHSHPVTVQPRPRTRQIVVRGEEPEVTREYREDEDKLVSPSSSEAEKTKTPQTAYIDELPEVRGPHDMRLWTSEKQRGGGEREREREKREGCLCSPTSPLERWEISLFL